METEDKIGSLFKEAFREHTEAVSLEELEAMRDLVSRKSFFSFTARIFNIYYAAAIVSGFIITMMLAGHYVYTISRGSSGFTTDKSKSEKYHRLPAHGLKENTSGKSNQTHPAYWLIQPTHTKANSSKNKNASPAALTTEKVKSEAMKQGKISNSPRCASYNKLLLKGDSVSSMQDRQDDINNGQSDLNQKPSALQVDSVKLVRKTVFIVQKDTIYQIDTLPANSRKKRKK